MALTSSTWLRARDSAHQGYGRHECSHVVWAVVGLGENASDVVAPISIEALLGTTTAFADGSWALRPIRCTSASSSWDHGSELYALATPASGVRERINRVARM